MVRDVVHPTAELVFDTTKPDGTPRKVLDVSRLTRSAGHRASSFEDGVRSTYEWYLAQTPGTIRGVEATPAFA